jgi:VWFA-related protein
MATMIRPALLLTLGLVLVAGPGVSPVRTQAPVPIQPGQPVPPQLRQPTFRATTQLVVQSVEVRDGDGAIIEGLTPRDFRVIENGMPQEIAFVEYQRIDNQALPPMAPLESLAVLADVQRLEPVFDRQLVMPQPGDIPYRDRRLVIIYFDLPGMGVDEQIRAYQGALDYIDLHMGSADLLAVVSLEGATLRVRHDFTDDRPALRAAVSELMYSSPEDLDALGSAFGEGMGEFRLFNNDLRLSALQRVVSMLERLPEKKALVYFSSNIAIGGVDNMAQYNATINAARRANVTINPVDARGLVALPPVVSARQRSPGGSAIFTGQAMLNTLTGFQRSQDSFYALARDTGGVALLDYNDLSAGITQAADAIDSHYLLGYYSTATPNDGRCRRVQVALATDRDADLEYRDRYCVEKEYGEMTTIERERQLFEAFRLENPMTEITIAMEVNFFQLTRAEYFVPVAVKIPGNELAIVRRRGAARTEFIFVGEVRDEFGTIVTNIRDQLPIRLDDQTAEELALRPLQYETGFTTLPGNYEIKLLVRDEETGRIGTFIGAFTIPNLNTAGGLPMSSVVLGSQRQKVDAALYSVEQAIEGAEEANPLVQDGLKLLPSVTRVFSAARDLYIYFQAYERGAETTQPLVAYAAFLRDGEKVRETMPVAVTEGLSGTSKAVPVSFAVPLAGLAPGPYELQVTVIEPGGRQARYWRSPIAIVP